MARPASRNPIDRSRFWVRAVFVASWLLFVLTFLLRVNGRYTQFPGSFDGGVFTQATWLMGHGGSYLTVHGLPALANHFPVILFPVAAVYRWFPDPRLLLDLQVIAVAFAAVPIFLLAALRLSEAWGLGLAGAYFLWPPTQYLCLQDFYADTLAMPLLAAMMYAAQIRRYAWAAAFAALAMACKEVVGVTVAGVGIVLVLQGHRRFGVSACALGLLWTCVITFAAIPSLHSGGSTFAAYLPQGPHAATVADGLAAYGAHAWDAGIAEYFVQLLSLGLFLLPLLGIESLLPALPTIAGCFLIVQAGAQRVSSHYLATVLPFLFMALITGIQRWPRGVAWLLRRTELDSRQTSLASAAAASLLAISMALPYALPAQPDRSGERRTVAQSVRWRAVALIPEGASVSAQSNLLVPLANRRDLYLFPNPFFRAYSLEDSGPHTWPDDEEHRRRMRANVRKAPVEYIVLDASRGHWPIEKRLYDHIRDALDQSGRYETIFAEGPVKVYRLKNS